MQKTRRISVYILTVILLITLSISIVQILKIYRDYAAESKLHQELLEYKPTDTDPSALTETEGALDSREAEREVVNQSVADLKERYPDTVGWVTIESAGIDYPFVQADDNQKYVVHDMDLKYLPAGTVFVDYRNSPDLTDFVSILYGHKMKNGSVFGSMHRFRADDFFLENNTGRIYLPYETLDLEIVAVLLVKMDDEIIYNLGADSDEEKQDFITYVYDNAEQLRRGVELTPQDRFVLLSTCAEDFDGARMLLVTRIM